MFFIYRSFLDTDFFSTISGKFRVRFSMDETSRKIEFGAQDTRRTDAGKK